MIHSLGSHGRDVDFMSKRFSCKPRINQLETLGVFPFFIVCCMMYCVPCYASFAVSAHNFDCRVSSDNLDSSVKRQNLLWRDESIIWCWVIGSVTSHNDRGMAPEALCAVVCPCPELQLYFRKGQPAFAIALAGGYADDDDSGAEFWWGSGLYSLMHKQYFSVLHLRQSSSSAESTSKAEFIEIISKAEFNVSLKDPELQ